MSPPSWVPVKRPGDGEQLAIRALSRVQELNDVVVGAGDVGARRVAVRSVVKLLARAVGIGDIQADLIAVLGIPAREHRLAIRKDRRREIVVGVEADLVHARAVAVHDVQQEDRLLPVRRHGLVLRPTLVDQDCLRRKLARRGEDDASVRQEVPADVVAGGDVIIGELRDRLGARVVLIDMPVGLLGIVVRERRV